jgi:hypothetical protein
LIAQAVLIIMVANLACQAMLTITYNQMGVLNMEEYICMKLHLYLLDVIIIKIAWEHSFREEQSIYNQKMKMLYFKL